MILNYLAEVWGISIVVVSLTFLIKPKYLKRLFAEVENEATMFFWGMISFIIGLAMILSYNIWAQNWQVIITVLGWLALLKGLAILFLPEHTKNWAKKIESAPFLPFVLLILTFIGLVITYLGFTA